MFQGILHFLPEYRSYGRYSGKWKYRLCGTCTIRLVARAYERKPWLRIIREPLAFGMRMMARWHGIDPGSYPVRTESCAGCLRFIKTALKEKPPAFRFFNDIINPRFDVLIERAVGRDEILKAKDYARRATLGETA